MIGSGIFTVIGTAIAGQKYDTSSIFNAPLLDYLVHHQAMTGRPGAGPALALSLVLVAIVCAFTGLCYAELASMIPIAGSAYTYTYATMGELIAWIIGWDLILEYAVSNMAVSVGFAQHLANMFDWFGWHPSLRWISPAYLPYGMQDLQGHDVLAHGWHFGFNIPAFLVVLLLTVVLVRGVRESAETNNVMVIMKIAAIFAFVIAGSYFIHPGNWHPFMPNGWPGVLTGGSIIFFTYIGFDSVSTAAEEAKNPQKDLPFGIIMTLIVCTILYIAVAVVLTGIVPWQSVADDAAPVVNALKKITDITGSNALNWTRLAVLVRGHDGHDLVAARVSVGAGAGMVRDVARRADAEDLQPRASEVPHAGVLDLGGGIRRRDSGGAAGYRHAGEPVEHRHAVCVRAGLGGRADPALQRSRSPSRVPRARRHRHPHPQHGLLFSADDRDWRSIPGFVFSSGWRSAWSFIGPIRGGIASSRSSKRHSPRDKSN